MKNLLLSALFAGLGLAASMNAAELPDATVTGGIMGNYTCSQEYMSNVDLQYLDNGEALTIDFVNAKIKFESWDIDHEYPVYYTDLTLVNENGVETTVTAGIYDQTGVSPMSVDTRGSDHSGNTVSVQLSSLNNYEWTKGEYTIVIPENTFVDMEGNINPAQEIKWTNLTQYATCDNSKIMPRPMSSTVSGVYTPAQLKAVTLPFNGEVVYNAGFITYGNDEVVPMENVKCEGNNLVIDLSYLPNGTYDFDIPSGFVTVGGNALFQFERITYIIWNGLPQGEMITGPAAKDNYVPNIELYFGSEIQPVGGQFMPISVYKNKYQASGTPEFEIPAENISLKEVSYGGKTIQVLYLDIEEIFADLTQVTYVIYIPENYVENSNHETNPSQQIKFTILPLASEPSITMTEEGIISLRWDNSKYFKETYTSSAYVILPDGTKKDLSYKRGTYDSGEITQITSGVWGVQVDLTNIIAEAGDGNYELVLPKAYLEMEIDGISHINPEVSYPFVIGNPPVPGLVEYTVTGTHTIYGEDGAVLSENKDSFIMTLLPYPEEDIIAAYTFAGYDIPAPYGYQLCYFMDIFGNGEYLIATESGGNFLTDFNEDGEAVVVASAGEEFTYNPWVTLTLPTDSENGTLSDFTIWVFNFDEYEAVALLDAWSNLTVTAGKTTGVDSIKPSTNGEEVIYNLNGVRVDRERMTNGIYIVNGKKVVVRK